MAIKFDKILGKTRELDEGTPTPLFPPAFLYQTIKVVQTLSDFPAPVANEILLDDDTIYYIDNGDLDILDNTIVFSQRSQVNGYGQNVSKISSSHSGSIGSPHVFFKSEKNLFMNDLEIQCKGTNQLVWQCLADGTTQGGESFELNRFHVICFLPSGHNNQLGYIKDIRQGFVGTFSTIGFENGFILAGAWAGGFRVDNTIFITGSGVFFGSDPLDPVTFLSRVSSNANINVPLGSIGYNFPSTSFTFDGQYQLQNGNAKGAGVLVTNFARGFPAYDPIGNFKNNTGIQNTFQGGEFITNADNVTLILMSNVWYQANLTTFNKGLTWFSESLGEFTYLSDTPLDVFLIYTITLTGKSNDVAQVKLVKVSSLGIETDLIIRAITIAGSTAQGRAESVPVSTTAQLVDGDTIKVYYRNTSGTSDLTTLTNSNGIISAK